MTQTINLEIKTPRWSLPLQKPARYKLIKGGRGSGKSHERAEALIEAMVMDVDLKAVCIREIQKSLKFSAYSLLKDKIQKLGVSSLFEITMSEIRRIGGSGICIFQGMQDHTADSIKSLEGFNIAWVEEAQSLSAKSLKLLRPTIRADDSEIWFTWNPDQPDDPVDRFAKDMKDSDDAIIVHVNYDQNPFLPKTLLDEVESDRKRYPDDFDHIWLGAYNLRKDIRVFQHWKVEECEPKEGEHLYFGCDWGFANDPLTLLRAWIDENEKTIYVDYQVDGIGVEIDETEDKFMQIPRAKDYVIRADNARPEMISHMKKKGFKIQGVEKGKGSVHDGVTWLRGYNIVIHPRCKLLEKELRLYSFKTNKAGDVLPDVEDANNHCIDGLRYAFEKLIKLSKGAWFMA